MNHYRHHIGDYRKDTAHLSLLEHGIYRQALDLYYLEEAPLPSDMQRLMRLLCVRNADEERSLCAVLDDFFALTDEGYVHARCERELEAIYAKSEKARESANKRWEHEKQPVSRKKKASDANAMRTHSEGNAKAMLPSNPVTQNPVPNKNPSVDSGESTQMAGAASDQKPAPEDKPASRFEEWWRQYPKKVAKKTAGAKWKAKRLDAKADELIADVCKRKAQDRKWLDGYIPNPVTYLTQERWNDEIEPSQGARNGRQEQGRAARFANRIDELASGAAGPALDGGDFQDAAGPVRRTLDVEPGGDRGARTLRVVEGAGWHGA